MSEHIEIEISGKKTPLVPTLEAMRIVNRYKGGLVEIQSAISKVDSEAIAVALGAGMGMKTSEQFDSIEQSIYREGIRNFVKPAGDFIIRLANGGKPIDEAKASDKEAPSGNAANG